MRHLYRCNFRYFIFFCAVFCVLAVPPLTSRAQPSAYITVVNHSNREISYVYLSHIDVDDWTANQLGNTKIGPGQSATISNITWNQSQMKVIGEDVNGCFVSTVVQSEGNSSWTVTDNTERDCGN